MKDAALKNQGHFKYNQYKNLLSTLRKRRKESYFTNYFQTNINDLKNTSKYIKSYHFQEELQILCLLMLLKILLH